jgi:hypothetical protein
MLLKLTLIYVLAAALSALLGHGRQTRESVSCGVVRGSVEARAMAIAAALSWPVRLVLWTLFSDGSGDGAVSIESQDEAPSDEVHPKISLHEPVTTNEVRATK